MVTCPETLRRIRDAASAGERGGRLRGDVQDAMSAHVIDLVRAVRSGRPVRARMENDALAAVASADLAAGAVLWRPVTNLVRAATMGGPAASRILDELGQGTFVASSFDPAKATATREGEGWRLNLRPALCTGVRYSSTLLVQADAEDSGKTVFAVDMDRAEVIGRPEFLGVKAADNAVITLDDVFVDERDVVGQVGRGADVVDAPYEHGMTLGALALGAARALRDVAIDTTGSASTDTVTAVVVSTAAIHALVETAAARAPSAGLWSRIAKLRGVEMALAACHEVRAASGASAYSESHPLNRIERDLRSLPFMAPSDANARARIADAHAQGHSFH